MTIGSLFSGIGGLELGLERAGLGPVIWQAESDAYCRRVLAKHWPRVKCYEDVRDIDAEAERPDIICGGFPCQDISTAGKQAGIDGERSGLWSEFARVLCVLRPRVAVIENVPALLTNGLDRVLRDLHEGGFDAEWDCISAASVGAPHRRDRVFIVAHANPDRGRQQVGPKLDSHQAQDTANGHPRRGHADGLRNEVADATSLHAQGLNNRSRKIKPRRSGWWETEPNVGRVADGVPRRVDRLKGLGNAVVPQVAEHIGRLIVGAR